MKKLAIFAAVIAVALMVAAPAMATDVTFKGQFRVRGFSDTSVALDDTNTGADSWWDQRFRLETVFTVTENLSVTTRFDALDNKVWGTPDAYLYYQGVTPATGQGDVPGLIDSNNTVDMDRIYMTIKTDFGKFDLGRMQGRSWGTLFMDSEADVYRVKYTVPIDNFVLFAIMEKQLEEDSFSYLSAGTTGNGAVIFPSAPAIWNTSDTDQETYYLAGIYRSEMITGGILFGYTTGKTSSDDLTGGQAVPLNQQAYNGFESSFWTIDPYFEAKWEDFSLQGEAMFRYGTAIEWDQDLYKNANTYPGSLTNPVVLNGVTYVGGAFKDIDWDAWAWNLEGGYDMGPLSFELGYAWMQGQGSEGAFDINGMPDQNTPKIKTLGDVGVDWDKLWILTATEDAVLTGALGGGSGNINGGVGANGAKIIYLGATFKPLENLSLGIIYGNAKAESVIVPTQSSDYGNEYDFKLVWNIYDNLTYTFIGAYLDAGDFWQTEVYNNANAQYQALYGANRYPTNPGATGVKLDNCFSLFHELKITF